MSRPLIRTASNTREFRRELNRASYAVRKFASNTIKHMDRMARRTAQIGAVAAGFAAKALIKQSDAYSDIQARLKLINDGQQTVAQFNRKIYKSADEARVKYQDIAGTVAKLGIVAKDAFKDNDEILKFTELLSKSFKIGGASAEEQSAAMYQLSQAMGAGRLQGDEFRSIMENAPTLAQAIAKEMGVTVGQLREMSSEGKITSDVIKRAMFNSADEINNKFEQMPMKFGDAVTKINNRIMKKLQPTFEKLSKWINSEEGEKTIDAIGDGIVSIVEYTPQAVESVKKLIKFTIEHKEEIASMAKAVAGFYIAAKGFQAMAGLIKIIKGIGIVATLAAGLTPVGIAITGIALAIGGAVAACIVFPEKVAEMKEKIVDMFTKLRERVIENWRKVIEFFKHPIKATVEYFEKGKERIQTQHEEGQKWAKGVGTSQTANKVNRLAAKNKRIIETGGKLPQSDRYGNNALGTSYWKGGWTSINERGQEMINLPNGSKVTPADKTRDIMSKPSVSIGNITIVAKGVTADEVVDEFATKLQLKLANM